MIPLRLTIENFMCYREGVPTLNLENVEIACLTGDNGHGKTALLDSITWAIWGPRDRVKECRFPVAVVSGKTGNFYVF